MCSALIVHAQDALELDEALQQALQNNHQIKALEYGKEIAENNVSWGNAGLLPSLSVSGSYGGNVQNTDLEFAGNIPPVNVEGAQSATLNANASLNYVLFNGLSGRRTYERLGINKLAVDEQSRAAVEATLLQIAAAYYALVRAQDQQSIAEERLVISRQRHERAEAANELGTMSKTEFLAAQVDLTTDSSSYLSASLQRKQASRNLCRLMGIAPNESLVTDEVSIELVEWTEEALLQTALQNNATVKNLELEQKLAEKDQQLTQSSYFPTIAVSGGFNYTNQQNEAGIILSNTAAGWNGNVSITYNLFNGFRNSTNRKNAQLVLDQRQIQLEDQKLQLQTDIGNALNAYQQSIQLLEFETTNLSASELNLQRSEELMKEGRITSTQFREAQLGLSNARIRIANAKISVKLNELEILRLTGQILGNS